jgi:choline dehydrogenase-like flavoprotein
VARIDWLEAGSHRIPPPLVQTDSTHGAMRAFALNTIRIGDEALAAHCRRFVKTNYHPAGTCRMGPPGDPLAARNSRLRLRGVDGLQVCDLSAMPDINAGNTAAPAMMLGSRCAGLVLVTGRSPIAG